MNRVKTSRAADPAAIRRELEQFCRDIEVTGGVLRLGGGLYGLEVDDGWTDLAWTYLMACKALRKRPKVSKSTRGEKIHAEDEAIARRL
jgi:hypothetical protein